MEYKDANPRIAAKKKAVQRNKKRKARRAAVITLVILLLFAAGAFVCGKFVFRVDSITVTGSIYYTEQELIDSCGVKNGDGLFFVSSRAIESKLKSTFPYIEKVKAERILPGHLKLNVTEATEQYCYSCNGKYYSVSAGGIALSEYTAAPAGLILVNAGSVSNITVGQAVAFADDTEKKHLEALIALLSEKQIEVSSISTADMLKIQIHIGDRFVVNFGAGNDLDGKIEHLASMLKSIGNDVTGTINLSAWSPDKTEGYFIQGNLPQ